MALYITLFTKSKHMTSKLSYLIWSPVSTLYAGNVCVTMRPFWCLRQISLHFKTWAFIQSPSKKVWCLYEPYACTQRAAFYLVLLCTKQGSRLTFQLASPVATDRFDLLAKTNFLLARHSQFCYGKNPPRLTSTKFSQPWFSQNCRQNFGTGVVPLSFKILIHNFHKQNTVFHFSSRRCKHRHQYYYRCRFRE